MSVHKTVRFTGQSSDPVVHNPITKPPTPPRSILSPKYRHRESPSPEPAPESLETSDDEVFIQVNGAEKENEKPVKSQEKEDLTTDIVKPTSAKHPSIITKPVSAQSTQLQTHSAHSKTCGVLPTRNKQLPTKYLKDDSRGQVYTVSSPRGCEDHIEVRHYRLKKDNSEHREKVNKCKFDKLTAKFKAELTRANKSFEDRPKVLYSSQNNNSLSERQDSWDIHPNLKTFSDKQETLLHKRQQPSQRLSKSPTNFSNNNNWDNLINSSEEIPNQVPNTEETSDYYQPRNNNSTEENNNNSVKNTSKMSESIFASPRLQEKQELQTLNARLSQYIRHIRELKENSGYLDSQVFLESVTVLEEELIKLKRLYDKELDDMRIKLDDVTRSKCHFELEEKKAKSLASELKNRLQIESEKNHKLHVEIQSLQRLMAQKDMQIEEGRIAIQTPMQQVDMLQREYDKMLREHEELKKRMDKEQLARQDAEDRCDTMKKKLDFQSTIHGQEKMEMTERITSANNTILAMEEKIREVSHHDKTLVEMLKRVRENSEEQLRQYQEEAEERHMRHLTELKAQIDEDDKRITEMTEENLKLNGDITNLYGMIRELEGQVGSLDHQKKCLLEQADNERRRSENHMKKMEVKLRELQEVLINKMRELNAARDAQIPLKAEIESFRAMIEEEERRLRIGTGDFPELPVIPQYNMTSTKKDHTINTTRGPVFMPRSEGYGVRSVVPNSRSHEQSVPSPRPLGPIKPSTAPASSMRRQYQQQLNVVPTNIGQGKDYFEMMFKDLKLSDSQRDEESSVSLNISRSSSEHAKSQIMKQLLEPIEPPTYSQAANKQVQILQVHDNSGSPQLAPSPPAMAKPMTSPVQDIHMSHFNDSDRPPSCTTHEYNNATTCATGDIQIFEVNPDGKYIRLVNTSQNKEEEFGGFLLQQNVGGHPVAVYRFPARTRFGAGETVTVWSGANDHKLHQPPSDYVFKEQQKWGTGPECTTILCKPNGQAVAWTTAAHRFSRDLYNECSAHNLSASPAHMGLEDEEEGNTNNNHNEEMTTRDEQLPEYNMNINGNQVEPVYLRREKEAPPSLAQPMHPHGTCPSADVHPATSQGRPMTYGNDNSSVNRQSRVQSTRPDPIPGAPYAGASAQRMGSASLRRYQGSGAIANKAGVYPGTETSQPPNSFQKPTNKFQTGLEQIQSQHHMDFQPPMPRPPLFSTW